MKYRLKDQMLQKKLDEITGGDFSKKLSETIERELSYPLQNPISAIPVAFGDWGADVYGDQSPRYIARFHLEEIEPVPEYNPKAWNLWPDTEPPENVQMRIEVMTTYPTEQEKVARYYCRAYWNGKDWIQPSGLAVYTEKGETVRYRPWEDE